MYSTLSLLADSTVAAAAGAVALRELDRLTVKGRSEPVGVYEVVAGAATPARAEARRRYAVGLGAYRARRFDEAREHFAAALKADPDDAPSREMSPRCDEYIVTPPPADWRGEHVLHSK